MKFIAIASLAAICALFLACGCSTVNWATPAKASYEPEEESWASRYIPGVKALSNAIPKPTEARIQWDQYHKNRNSSWNTDDNLGRPFP
jgi:hypothetical protein